MDNHARQQKYQDDIKAMLHLLSQTNGLYWPRVRNVTFAIQQQEHQPLKYLSVTQLRQYIELPAAKLPIEEISKNLKNRDQLFELWKQRKNDIAIIPLAGESDRLLVVRFSLTAIPVIFIIEYHDEITEEDLKKINSSMNQIAFHPEYGNIIKMLNAL